MTLPPAYHYQLTKIADQWVLERVAFNGQRDALGFYSSRAEGMRDLQNVQGEVGRSTSRNCPCPQCGEPCIGNVCPRCRYSIKSGLTLWSGQGGNLQTIPLPGTNGPLNGTTFVNIPGGDADWLFPDAATLSDDNYAFAVFAAFPPGLSSSLLRVSGFGGSVPAGATVNGIQVDVERHKANLPGTCVDSEVYLLKGGVRTGTNHASAADWPTPTDAYVSYGGTTDTWGTTWTPAQVNASDFGFELGILVDAGSQGGFIDHIRVTISYTT